MEEKERYELEILNDGIICIVDNDNRLGKTVTLKQIRDLLNQQNKENQQLKQQIAESEKEIASIQVLLSENASDRKAMQEFKIGEDEYDLTDEDARNSLCWEVEELNQQLHDLPKKIVEEIMEYCKEHFNPIEGELGCIVSINREEFGEFICTILKKYGGENE